MSTIRPPFRLAPLLAHFALAAAVALPAAATDGEFDPLFDGDGHYEYTSPGSYGSSMLRAPDDAVVVWGTRTGATSVSEIHWRRITVGGPGTLCTFAAAGATYLAANAAAFDPDGRLLVAASVDYGAGTVLGVLRILYPACTLDSDFDGGFAVHALPLGGGGSPTFAGVAGARWYTTFPLQARRVLVAVSKSTDPGEWNTWLARLRDDGSIDTGFGGGDGVAMIAPQRNPRALLPTFSGRFVVVGTTPYGDDFDTFALEIDRDGVPNPAFGNAGEVTIDFTPTGDSQDDLTRVALAPDGRIALAGSTDLDAQPGVFVNRPAMAMLTPSGQPDTTFSADGQTYTAAFGYSSYARAVAVQGDGKMLVAVSAQDEPSPLFGAGDPDGSGLVLRRSRTGPLDATFGVGGQVAFDWDLVEDGNDGVGGVALAEDGRIWISGAVETPVGGGETEQRVWVGRLVSSYIFADGFERGSLAAW